MIGLIFTLTCLFNIRGGLISIKKTQLLKNKFWNGSQETSKTGKGFLHSVSVSVEDGSGLYDSDNYYFETCHYIQTTDHRYIVASDRLIKDINLHLESLKENKSFMRFTFLFTDEPIKNGESYDKYVGEKQFYTNFEPFEKMTENGKNDLKYDDILMHVYNIEDIISDLVFKDLIMLNEYIFDLGKIRSNDNLGEIEEKANFSLYFFKNYSDCLNCLKEFVKVFCHITLVKDSDSESINNEANTIKESQFMNQLNEKFNNILQYTDNNNSVGKEQCKILKQCFDMCSYHLKNMILANNTAFPIGCGYDMNYYITELCKHIYKSFKSCQIKYDLCDQNNIFLIVKEMNDLIDYYLVMLLVLAVKDLCFPEYVNNHFVKMIGKEIETLEDYITVEKAVCDYHNMFVYISNLALKKEDEMGDLLPYFHPISNENYNCKIVDGIEIKFEHPAKFGQINGFDEEENETVLVKDMDYFIEEFDKVYLISEILKMKKIAEIEIISPISFFNKRFKVNKYLI